jgi:hypothetical protein
MKYPSFFGPKIGGFQANLGIVQEQVAFPVAFYSATVQDGLAKVFPDLAQVSEDYLVTNEGRDYFRWEFTFTQNGIALREIFYFFESGDWKLVMVYARPADQGAELDALVEEAIKTVRYTP